MARRARRPRVRLDEAELDAADEILRELSAALDHDQRRLRSLVGRSRDHVDEDLRRRLERDQERNASRRRRAVARVRGSRGRTTNALAELARRSRTATAHPARSSESHSAAIEGLSRTLARVVATQGEMARALAHLQARGDLPLQHALVDGARRQRARSRKLGRDQSQQRRSAAINVLHTTATRLQSSAYGTEGDPFHPNNLIIGANHLLWTLLGDAAAKLGVTGLRDSAVAWLLPLANLATGVVLLGDRQHERFVSDIASGFSATGPLVATTTFSLQGRIAPDLWPEFRRRDDVAVVVTAIEAPPLSSTSAVVVDGVLTITVEAPVAPGSFADTRVAWLVDTNEPDA